MNESDEIADRFLRAMFEFVAHGDDEHRRWLLTETLRWSRPLARIIDDAIKLGVTRGQNSVSTK